MFFLRLQWDRVIPNIRVDLQSRRRRLRPNVSLGGGTTSALSPKGEDKGGGAPLSSAHTAPGGLAFAISALYVLFGAMLVRAF